MIEIVFTAFQGVHQLTHDQNRWITGIIIDVFQSFIHSVLVYGRQNLYVISALAERRLQESKMNRRHLRRQERVILLHLLGKYDLFKFVLRRPYGTGGRSLHLIAFIHRSLQGAQPDSNRAQVAAFIDLDHHIGLAM